MKAIIVEIKGDYVAAMTYDGDIVRLKNQDFRVGEVIIMKKNHKKKMRSRVFATTSAAVLILLCVGVWSFFSPYTYVSLDVNPSVEYSVNRYGVVISANAVNDDGKEILEGIDLKYSKIEDAVIQTVELIGDEGYFDEEEYGGMILAFSCENEQDAIELQNRLQLQIQEIVNEDYGEGQVDVETISVGSARVEEAKELGVTPGKLHLVEKLIESSDDPDSIDKEVWLNMPVKDIMKTTIANKKADQEEKQSENAPNNNSSNSDKEKKVKEDKEDKVKDDKVKDDEEVEEED